MTLARSNANDAIRVTTDTGYSLSRYISSVDNWRTLLVLDVANGKSGSISFVGVLQVTENSLQSVMDLDFSCLIRKTHSGGHPDELRSNFTYRTGDYQPAVAASLELRLRTITAGRQVVLEARTATYTLLLNLLPLTVLKSDCTVTSSSALSKRTAIGWIDNDG